MIITRFFRQTGHDFHEVDSKIGLLLILSMMVLSVVFSPTGKSIFADQPTEKIKDISSLSGKVVETMDGGRYTYVCLEKNDKKIWVAVYKMTIVVGQNMSPFKPGIRTGATQ